MKPENVVILGGTGFVGRHLARRLVADGHFVKIISNRRERSRELLTLPTVTVVRGDVHQDSVLDREFAGASVAVNLVGVLHSGSGRASFNEAHEQLPQRVAQACQRAGVGRLLHMSGLHAASDGPSDYLRSKGIGENAVLEVAASGAPAVTVFRPSVIFGPDDSFINRFAELLRMSPGFIPLACANARFQPVYIDDVVTAMVRSLSNPATIGHRYDLVGPTQYTLHEIVSFINGLTGANRRILKLGSGLSKLMAFFLQFAPGKPLAPDNVRSMSIDSVSDAGFPQIFGIEPTSLESAVPNWLARGADPLDTYRSRPRRGSPLFANDVARSSRKA